MSSSNFVDVEKKISDWKLTFNNRRYHKGLNITFRDGTHYALSMKPGDNILMVDKFGSVLGKARVVSAEALNIKKFPTQAEYLLNFEPDHEIRTIEDLTKILNDVYGEKNWGPVLSAVAFWVD